MVLSTIWGVAYNLTLNVLKIIKNRIESKNYLKKESFVFKIIYTKI